MSFRCLKCFVSKVFINQEIQHIIPLHSRCIRSRAGMTIRPKRIESVTRKGKEAEVGSSVAVRMGPRHLGRMMEENDNTTLYGDLHERNELDRIANSIITYGSKYSAMKAEREKTKELMKLSSFVRTKTLENRHFKQPKKPNLLTWACKEQIRFLYEKDPDVWSIQALADTFPVSEISIKKILKSRVRLHRLVDIKEHDLLVKRNWENVHASLISKRNVMVDEATSDILTNIGNEDNIFNVFPLENELISKQLSIVPKRLGTFSSIVKDELEKKELENNILGKKHQEQLDLLKDIVFKVKKIIAQRSAKTEIKQKPEKSEQSYRRSYDPFEISALNSSGKADADTSYLVDGCVYDENGDFLYKIP